MKLSLSYGDAKIEIEGELVEVETVLRDFWLPIMEKAPANEAAMQQPQAPSETEGPSTNAKKAKTKKSSGTTTQGSEEDRAFEEDLANRIKNSPNYKEINQKFVVEKASKIEQCKLILHFSEKPVHSGNITRTLLKLGVRAELTAISKALSANKSLFITSGTNPILYEFSGSTRHDFSQVMSELNG
ncbi:hypothetical protein [Celeribacter ethanolicus]|uniref:hypothetical protein n=1 Tax=Celeribacter ethanolicus TaxID=1758178 RepID=UPI0012FD5087|nr:hypothetical protein [Celeribacter ethanolicus]